MGPPKIFSATGWPDQRPQPIGQIASVQAHPPRGSTIATAQNILNEASRIVRTELPKHLSADFGINDVAAEILSGPDCEDYIYVNVILEGGQPDPDAHELLRFNEALRPIFERAGVIPIPTISYSNARSRRPRQAQAD